MVETIDIKRLKTAALESCCRESYLVLLKCPLYRIGAGARLDGSKDYILSIDISINLCPGNSHTNTSTLEKGIMFAKGLKELGYEMNCLEGQINCEISVTEIEMNLEYKKILALLEELDMS